jgi:hypothetical protein
MTASHINPLDMGFMNNITADYIFLAKNCIT